MRRTQLFLYALIFVAGTGIVCAEPSEKDLQSRILQAQALWKQGDYLAAKKSYEEILGDPLLMVKQRNEVRNDYGALNLQILFSRYQTPNSFFHTVVSGESLYKVAKKYGITVELLKRSNGLKGDVIYPGMKLKIQKGVFSIRVDKSENILVLLLDGKEVKYYSVATGKDESTPVGEFNIKSKIENPTWYRAGAIVSPESPENILGARWLGFDYPGYGIHGTTEPESIGKQITAGCIRMLNRDVEELYTIVPRGTKVVITD